MEAVTDSKDSQTKETKIPIFLRSIGEATPLARNKFVLSGTRTLIDIDKFLKKTLKLPPEKNFYFYCGSGFSPTPDQQLQDLYDCFQVSGELVVMYGVQETWG